MMLVSNRKREKVIFDIFQGKYALSETFTQGDSPDFVGPHEKSILGIEITELYSPDEINGKTRREHEATRERIVERACQKAVQMGMPPLHVPLSFAIVHAQVFFT